MGNQLKIFLIIFISKDDHKRAKFKDDSDISFQDLDVDFYIKDKQTSKPKPFKKNEKSLSSVEMNDISELKSTIRFEKPKNVGIKSITNKLTNLKQIKLPEYKKNSTNSVLKKYVDDDKENFQDYQINNGFIQNKYL